MEDEARGDGLRALGPGAKGARLGIGFTAATATHGP